MSAVMQRSTFETSRMLEYFTEKELRAQIGHDVPYWPIAILRELIDNALDACEGANVVPEILITTDGDSITVTDNGPGMLAATIEKSLDYLVRVSSKAYYISPTRGAMGNAMKVVWAAPFVATGGGSVEILVRGEHHRVEVALDRIAQKPTIRHSIETVPVKAGTSVKIRWTDCSRLLNERDQDSYNRPPTAYALIAGFAAFNPHATFLLDSKQIGRNSSSWSKWSPSQPTSAHWYTPETLRDLIAAYIAKGEQKTVREFVAEFRGLSATAKHKIVTEGWSGKRLQDFVINGDLDPQFVQSLLERMKTASSAPPATALGAIGKDHLTAWMIEHGVTPQSIRYQRKADVDGLPYVLEIAFGVNDDDESQRRIVTGLNWSPVIGGDPDPTLRSVIAEARLDADDPVTLIVHIARPRFQFVDRGKTRVSL